ncbi:MAG TPA: periplasmic heavy metal sensor [Gallionellaceae bacterium]|nr:periplasmic heavy metal sensor [Gallionellaceae bacterium]
MKQSTRFVMIVAIAYAAMLVITSPTLMAADPKAQNPSGYPPYYMGPGMMGGGYGMGPGMMWDGNPMGRHMGPGMMGGYGYGGMGPGMMGGRMGLFEALDLTDEQQAKINKIQDETRKTNWALMGEIMDQQSELRDLYAAPKQDSAAIDKAYKKLGQMQQKMYDTGVEAQKRMEAILTKEQQEKLRKYSRRGW